MNRYLAAICAALLLTTVSRLSADEPIAPARQAAQAWLALIDAGQFEASYAASGEALHQVITREKWDTVLKTIRPALGALVTRTEAKHLYQPNGLRDLSGECMIIGYNTTFKKEADEVVEVVILHLENNQWRCIGYTVGPKPGTPGAGQPTSPPAAQSTTDTTHTQPNQAPPLPQNH